MKIKIPPYIQDIQPYVPGKPIEELQRQYGITDSIKLASNENPLGPCPAAVAAIQDCLGRLHRYPDGAGYELVNAIADDIRVETTNVVLGNGSDELMAIAARALLEPGDTVVLPQPSFLMYEITARAAGARPVFVPLKDLSIDLPAMLKQVTAQTKMVFICNPNNPTGTIVHKEPFIAFLSALPPHVVVVVDEAYMEFVRDGDCALGVDYLDHNPPVITLRTFSKAYGLAGLRIGYAIVPKALWDIFNRVRAPFNTSIIAQAAAAAALQDKNFLRRTIRTVHEGLDYLYRELDALGVGYFPSQANFFMIDVQRPADDVFEEMMQMGVIVRSMRSYGYPAYIRINAGLPEENRRFIKALRHVLSGH